MNCFLVIFFTVDVPQLSTLSWKLIYLDNKLEKCIYKICFIYLIFWAFFVFLSCCFIFNFLLLFSCVFHSFSFIFLCWSELLDVPLWAPVKHKIKERNFWCKSMWRLVNLIERKKIFFVLDVFSVTDVFKSSRPLDVIVLCLLKRKKSKTKLIERFPEKIE